MTSWYMCFGLYNSTENWKGKKIQVKRTQENRSYIASKEATNNRKEKQKIKVWYERVNKISIELLLLFVFSLKSL